MSKEKLTKAEEKAIKEGIEKASKPTVLTDDQVKLGGGELDIRELNDKNFKQVMFRLIASQNGQLQAISEILADTLRMVMVLLTTQGIKPEDISTKVGELMEALTSKIKKDRKEQA